MNDSTLTQLKILVERAVRPLCASLHRKRKMREELLGHVSAVFEEEQARLNDEHAALAQTAARFGDAAEVTHQLQESIPARDAIRRFWEGPPGEPALRSAVRIAWATSVVAVIVFVALLALSGSVSDWPRDAFIVCVYSMFALPMYLFGVTLLTDRLEKALHGERRSTWKTVLLVLGSWLLIMAWVLGPVDWDWTALLIGLWLSPMAVLPWALAKSAVLRRAYAEEWANLSIDGATGAMA